MKRLILRSTAVALLRARAPGVAADQRTPELANETQDPVADLIRVPFDTPIATRYKAATSDLAPDGQRRFQFLVARGGASREGRD